MSHDLQQSTPTTSAMTIRHVFFLWEKVSQNLSSYMSQFTNIVNMMDIKITVNLETRAIVGLSLLKYKCPLRLN